MDEVLKTDAAEPGQESGQQRRRYWVSRLPVPFVTTESATDVALTFALLPIWWVLGLNELLWAPVALFIYLKRTMVEKKLDHVRLATLIAVGAFVASYLATSGILWVYSPRFFQTSLPFYFQANTYVAAVVFLVVAADCAASSERERLRVVVGIGAMGLGAGLLGMLPYLGPYLVLPDRFYAPVRLILPEGLSLNQGGGAQIYERSVNRLLGGSTCFFGYEAPRHKSFFTYATHYASAMAVVAPLQLYLAHRAGRGVVRLLWGAGVMLSVAGVVLTTSRVPIAALLVAGLIVGLGWWAWAFFVRRVERRRLLAGLLGITCAGTILLTAGPWAAGTAASAATAAGLLEECGELNSPSTSARESLLSEDRDAASLLKSGIVDARDNSTRHRMEVYQATLERWEERPWFGFGSTKKNPDVRYPLGSHSTYLGILFQRGAVGLAALLALMGYASYRIAHGLLSRRSAFARPFFAFAAAAMISGSIAGLTSNLERDATLQVLFWTLMGLAIGTSYAAVGREKGPSLQEEEKYRGHRREESQRAE